MQEDYIKEEQRNLKRELLRAQEEVKRIQCAPVVFVFGGGGGGVGAVFSSHALAVLIFSGPRRKSSASGTPPFCQCSWGGEGSLAFTWSALLYTTVCHG